MINKKNDEDETIHLFYFNKENESENFEKRLKKNNLKNKDNNIDLSEIPKYELSKTNINSSKRKLNNSHSPPKKKRIKSLKPQFDNYDIQKLKYSLIKDYTSLKIDKEEKFLDRMRFDIYKRQTQNERIDKMIEENKIKINEEQRIKTFNRLIEDANRRNEKKHHKFKENNISPKKKKYNYNEWNNIYQKRFKSYEDKSKKKLEKNRIEEYEKQKKKEEDEIKMCKIKKASIKHIEEASKKMYEESKKNQIKKLLIDFDNEPMKFRKSFNEVKYHFIDDDNNKEINNNKKLNDKTINNKTINRNDNNLNYQNYNYSHENLFDKNNNKNNLFNNNLSEKYSPKYISKINYETIGNESDIKNNVEIKLKSYSKGKNSSFRNYYGLKNSFGKENFPFTELNEASKIVNQFFLKK